MPAVVIRVFLASNLSDDERIVLEKIKELTKYTADDFRDSIASFSKKLLDIGYGMQSSAGIVCYLNWLSVFLASAGMGYSMQAADL